MEDDYDDYRDYEASNPPEWIEPFQEVTFSYDEALNRWATEKFPDIAPIKDVIVSTQYDYGYSEYTPGNGWELEITVHGEKGKRYAWYGEHEAGVFMQEITR